MDEDLAELERRARANPADVDAAAKLDHGLLRAGRLAEVATRYRFKFRCPLRFDDLAAGATPLERNCERCQRTVHFVTTPEDLAERVANKQCVAFPRDSLAAAAVHLARDPRLHSAEEQARPCVQNSDLAFVDLDTHVIPAEVVEQVPATFARTYRTVPVGFHEKERVLAVACDAANVALALDDLRFMLNVEVALVHSDPGALDRALERLYPSDSAEPPLPLLGEVIIE